MSSFGDKLRKCRQAFSLSQEQLAFKFDTTKQVISHYENGQRTPKIDIASHYADILNVPIEYLTNDLISFNVWPSDLLEEYWDASPSVRLKLVVRRGIDPRIANDYKVLRTIEKFVKANGENLSPEEHKIIDAYRYLNQSGKNHILKQIDFALSQDDFKPQKEASSSSTESAV